MFGRSRQLERLRSQSFGSRKLQTAKSRRDSIEGGAGAFSRMVQCDFDLAASRLAQTLAPMLPVRLLGCAQQPQVTAAAPACVGPDLLGPAGRTAHLRLLVMPRSPSPVAIPASDPPDDRLTNDAFKRLAGRRRDLRPFGGSIEFRLRPVGRLRRRGSTSMVRSSSASWELAVAISCLARAARSSANSIASRKAGSIASWLLWRAGCRFPRAAALSTAWRLGW